MITLTSTRRNGDQVYKLVREDLGISPTLTGGLTLRDLLATYSMLTVEQIPLEDVMLLFPQIQIQE